MDHAIPTSPNRLLARLSPGDLASLAPNLKTMPLKLGKTLQHEGSPIEEVIFPLEGMISLLAVQPDGACVETGIIGREGVLGAAAGFRDHSSFARAIVQAPGTASRIGIAHFRQSVGLSEALRNLIRDNSEMMLAQAQQAAACNALHALEARLARWLLQTRDRVSVDTLPLTQEFLSQMLGVRRTSVTLAAQQLQKTGAIRYRRARIEIVDRRALEELACDCYEIMRRHREGIANRGE